LQELLIAPYETLDPGDGVAIIVDRWNQHVGLVIVAGTAETNTLAAPVQAGEKISFIAMTVGAGGTRAITAASAINSSSNTIMTFNAVDDAITLESFPVGSATYEWRITFNSGVALS